MIIKIARIIVKTVFILILTIFSLYMSISYIVIPIGLPLVAKWQGSKILHHPVSLGGAHFNPLTWNFSLSNFKILDDDKQEMFAFKRFWTDVSVFKLFKKQIRIQSVGLDGLKLNVVLLPENKVNLLNLLPPEAQPKPQEAAPGTAQEPAKPEVKTEQPSSSAQPAKPLPDVVVDEIVLKNGAVTFTDKDIGVGFITRINAMDMRITGVSTKPDSEVRLVYSSAIDDNGRISAEALLKPFVQPLSMEAKFSLNGYAMRALTPYVGKYTGRAVEKGGKLDFTVNYRIADNKLTASHKVLVQKFNFGEPVESKDALSLPFGLALALLKDPSDKISISLPVTGDISDPKFEYFHLVGQVAANFFIKLITAPFKVLFAFVPSAGSGTEEMGVVSFEPGVSVLSDAEKAKVEPLAKLMKERPALFLEINGSYDPEADWPVMKMQAFEKDYAARLKDTSFGELRVYEDLYKYNFGLSEFWTLLHKYTKDKKVDEEGFKAEAKRQILEKGAPDKAALEALAQQRAKVVYDAFMGFGYDPGRARIGSTRATKASMGVIPMEFTITLFEETKKTEN